LLIDTINKYRVKQKLLFWVLASIWIASIVFSAIGYAVGTPWDDWLTSNLTKSHAQFYYALVIAMGVGLSYIRNLLIKYICSLIFLWLIPFWKVSANLAPGISSFVSTILIIFLLIVVFINTSSDRKK